MDSPDTDLVTNLRAALATAIEEADRRGGANHARAVAIQAMSQMLLDFAHQVSGLHTVISLPSEQSDRLAAIVTTLIDSVDRRFNLTVRPALELAYRLDQQPSPPPEEDASACPTTILQ